MKRFTSFLFIFSIFSFCLYCQDTDNVEIGSSESISKLLVLNQNKLFNISYQFPDGTDVSSAEMMKLLNIPSNQALLKQCRQLSIVNRLLNIVTLASASGMFAYIFADLPHSDIILPALSGVCVTSVAVNLITVQMTSMKILYAVDNYNLQLFGIPIVTKDKKK